MGSVWNGGHKGEPGLLAHCYRNSLRLATEHELASVAFPGISIGIYSYPKKEAAAIAVHEVRQWLAAHEFPQTVVFVTFDEESWRLYKQEVQPQRELAGSARAGQVFIVALHHFYHFAVVQFACTQGRH